MKVLLEPPPNLPAERESKRPSRKQETLREPDKRRLAELLGQLGTFDNVISLEELQALREGS